jgi:hypothetical protein
VSDSPIDDLARRLHLNTDELAVLTDFDDDEQARFAGIVEQAVTRQSAQIDEALETALRFVPRLLRGRARALLLPGGDRG